MSVVITSGQTSLEVGHSARFSAQVSVRGGADASVTWTSGATSVAVVDAEGTVYALGVGQATITATSAFDHTKAASRTVHVSAPVDEPDQPEVVSVFITGGERSIQVGGSTTLSALVAVKGGASTAVAWSSSDPVVGTVDSTGVVRGLVAGTTTVTATSVLDNTKSASVVLVVVEADSPAVNHPPSASITVTGPTNGFAPLVVGFDAGASADPDGDSLDHYWEFGDGLTAHGVQVEHSYVSLGRFVARLTVIDIHGATASATMEVLVGPLAYRERLATTRPPADNYSCQWIAVDGDIALVPAVTGTATTFTQVDVHRADSTRWILEASLAPTFFRGEIMDVGRAVALSGDTAAILSLRRISGLTDDYESVVSIFERSPTGEWTETAALLGGLGIGTLLTWRADVSMALGADVLAVGITSGDDSFGAKANIYLRDHGGQGVWGLEDTLTMPPSAPTGFSGFYGTDVAVSNDGSRVVVAKSMQNNDGGIGPGLESAYIYERTSEGPWSLVKVITDLPSWQSTYVEIDGDTLAITHMPEVNGMEVDVMIYEKDAGGPGNWGAVARHTADIPEMRQNNGMRLARSSISLSSNSLAVGIAIFDCDPEDGTNCGPGRVYLYGRDVGGRGSWGEAQVLHIQGSAGEYTFGTAVDLSSDGRTLLVATAGGYVAVPGAEVFRYSR